MAPVIRSLKKAGLATSPVWTAAFALHSQTYLSPKKARTGRAENTGSNVSNVVSFFGRATVGGQENNNHSQYIL